MKNLNKEKLIKYWIKSSDNDFKTMNDLFKTKNYSWSLFVGHLVIEKPAKAMYVCKKNDYPPLIHDLRRICEKSGVVVDDEHKIFLDTITKFNINARYDDFKENFYHLCTQKFTKEWIEKIKELRKWIKKKLLK